MKEDKETKAFFDAVDEIGFKFWVCPNRCNDFVDWDGDKATCRKCGKDNQHQTKCQICGKEGAENRRQITAYADDKQNFATLCDGCQEETNEYWQDQWNDYYSMVL